MIFKTKVVFNRRHEEFQIELNKVIAEFQLEGYEVEVQFQMGAWGGDSSNYAHSFSALVIAHDVYTQ